MRDRGSTLVLVLLAATALAWTVMVATVALTTHLGAVSRAQAAADAGALAGVTEGRLGAAEVVRRNGARLTDWHVVVVGDGRRVTVTTEFGGVTATARATDEP